VTLGVTAGDRKGQLTFEAGADLAEPIDAEEKGRVSTRVGRLLSLARVFWAAAKAGELPALDEPPHSTAVVLVPSEKVDLQASFMGTNLYYFGDAKTLGDVARFAVATRGATEPIGRCGPYRNSGDSMGSTTMVGRTELDMNVQAWTRRGEALPEGVEEGGDGCPKRTTINPLGNDDYVDGPPNYAIGAWVLDQVAP